MKWALKHIHDKLTAVVSFTFVALRQVSLGMVDGGILQIMLEYMYTGKCLFPRDDLNKALEVIYIVQYYDL